jgi:hypothetical protein
MPITKFDLLLAFILAGAYRDRDGRGIVTCVMREQRQTERKR